MPKKKKPKKVNWIKALSREVLGPPGLGRKTSWEDRKAKADREACRQKVDPEG